MRLSPISTRLFLATLFLLLLNAAALAEEPRWGRLYVVTGNVSVRESPADGALKVRVLKAGQTVRVDFQDEAWAAVFDPKEQVRSELKAMGYAKLTDLKANGRLELAQPVSSIEVRKPRPDAKPEVVINGRPEKASLPAKSAEKPGKPEGKTDGKTGASTDSKVAVKATQSADSTGKPGRPDKSDTSGKPAKADKAAKGFGELRVADRALSVRAQRDKESEFKRLLQPGQRVRVDFLEDGWFAVFDPEEKTRDLARAWGYSRDKYLVPEGSYVGVPPEAVSNVPAGRPAPAVPAASAPAAAAHAAQAQTASALAKGQKAKAEGDVGYAVLTRKEDRKKPPTVTLRVRLDLARPPAPEALRKIAREIWKAERKKDENLQLELLLNGMDAGGLAYAMARFHEDGRLREFWWREVVLGKPQ